MGRTAVRNGDCGKFIAAGHCDEKKLSDVSMAGGGGVERNTAYCAATTILKAALQGQ